MIFGEREISGTRPNLAHPRYATDAGVEPGPRREATISVTDMNRFRDLPTTAPSAPQRWIPDSTTPGVALLAEALPPEPPATTEPFPRPSYTSIDPVPAGWETLALGAGARPSALRFDDEATQHGFVRPPEATADTSNEELQPDDPAVVLDAPRDEPIDDDLGSLATPVPGMGERRRSVVVAGLLGGAPVEVTRPIARSLGELAYQRGGVVTALDDDGLVIAFGLEVAGEDDVAIAMGWALDAGAIVRDAVAGLALRVGGRAGVATSASVPAEAVEEARSLAREASPDRPLFVGGGGRL